MNDLEYHAHQYADRGLAIIPLKKDKTPLTSHGLKDASKDNATISAWWKQWPEANIGIVTGQVSGGTCVIDQDEKNGEHGIETFEKWIDDNMQFFDDTWTSRTASGGLHSFIRSNIPVASRIGWLPGVDVRGEGGYIVAPPSVLSDGSRYEWILSPADVDPISNDDDPNVEYIISEINKKSETAAPLVVPETINKGGRNDMLYKFACSLQRQGVSDSAILAAVQAENSAKCDPPLSDAEVQKLVKSALTKEKGSGGTETNVDQKGRDFSQIKLVKASEIMEKELPKLNVLIGEGEEIPFLVEGTCILSAKSKTGK
ncbi:MAG: bifunctional DNA primase/polymerase, partial [Erysipelotrichaceae bacterium]|nr:bifunctional DNA primase/polymerase [Erysipelotrichaceae bacterium]